LRIESQILIIVLIMNLTVLMIMDLGSIGAIPGVVYMQQLNATGTTTQYQERFNASAIIDPRTGWNPPTVSIPIIGDVFGGLMFFFKQVAFIIAGFPLWLLSLGNTYITDTNGLLTWNIIAGTISAIFGIYMSWFIIQLITGRVLNE
jgi:hypothetical protein